MLVLDEESNLADWYSRRPERTIVKFEMEPPRNTDEDSMGSKRYSIQRHVFWGSAMN